MPDYIIIIPASNSCAEYILVYPPRIPLLTTYVRTYVRTRIYPARSEGIAKLKQHEEGEREEETGSAPHKPPRDISSSKA